MLLGNYSVQLKSPGKWIGGLTVSDARSNFMQSGRQRSMFYMNSSVNKIVSKPPGRRPPYSLIIAQKDGGLAATTYLSGSQSISSANLAGGLNAVANLTGTGNISDAAIAYAGILVAALTGTSDLTASTTTVANITASLTSISGFAADILAAINAQASISGTSTLVSDFVAALDMLANLTGSGDINSANLAGAILAVGSITGSSSVTASADAIWTMIASLTGSSTATGGATAKGNIGSSLAGTGTLVGATGGTVGDMSADLDSVGSVLSTANVAEYVWAGLAETGYTYQEAIRILLAVAAGKTTIVDLGGGDATVVFRDVNDTTDRVSADMTGSERTTVTLDVA